MQSLITLVAVALAIVPAIAVPVDVAHHNVQGGVGLNMPHMRDLNGRDLASDIAHVLPPPPPPPQTPPPPAPGVPSRRDVEDDC
ncbi:hypothetical protein NLI96_g913 [Meripilus lineatus]|uniref:Uncharacterized protein n=1 Tax=Meripilus lineatus TaxID=2056292 RepID=A0AAD5VBC8_9APHY|nr:hypothetical protein NLI96_g913 [Physisporinus lineatus]